MQPNLRFMLSSMTLVVESMPTEAMCLDAFTWHKWSQYPHVPDTLQMQI